MGVVSQLLKEVPLPKMQNVCQKFDDFCIKTEEIPSIIKSEFERAGIGEKIRPGMEIAITAGSRGIANIPVILKAIADEVRTRNGKPFLVPAMGSHGGATAKGQKEVLEGYGITEEAVGCPICSDMETVVIGKTEDGRNVYMDKKAANADGIIVCGRIKPHTGYRGEYESGIMKMMAIGLGKQKGAEVIHADGFGEMYRNIPMFGKVILKNAPVLFGVAILENAYDKTRELHALTPEEILIQEPVLLKKAKAYMPSLPFEKCDVLVIDRIGKNISGDGMDPNISGRFPTPYATGGIQAQRVVVLDLTEETHGNACGIGLADCTTKKLFSHMDLEATYPNAITNTVVGELKIPMMMNSDREAIQLGIKTCNKIDWQNVKMIHIKDTLSMEQIEISEAFCKEKSWKNHLTFEGDLHSWKFAEEGNLDDKCIADQ